MSNVRRDIVSGLELCRSDLVRLRPAVCSLSFQVSNKALKPTDSQGSSPHPRQPGLMAALATPRNFTHPKASGLGSPRKASNSLDIYMHTGTNTSPVPRNTTQWGPQQLAVVAQAVDTIVQSCAVRDSLTNAGADAVRTSRSTTRWDLQRVTPRT